MIEGYNIYEKKLPHYYIIQNLPIYDGVQPNIYRHLLLYLSTLSFVSELLMDPFF